MIPRIEIDDAKKQRIINMAAHLGTGELEKNYGA